MIEEIKFQYKTRNKCYKPDKCCCVCKYHKKVNNACSVTPDTVNHCVCDHSLSFYICDNDINGSRVVNLAPNHGLCNSFEHKYVDNEMKIIEFILPWIPIVFFIFLCILLLIY